MAQSGYTPIQLYYSSTTTSVPSAGNLANGELAINITDGKLFYKDNTGTVQTLVNKNSTGTVTSVAMTVPAFLSISGSPVTSSGTLAVSYSGTALPVANGGTGTTTSTGSGNVVLSTSPTLSGITVNDGYTEEVATANTGASYTIDLANGTVQILTLTATCTFTFPTPTAGKSFILLLKQDSTGGYGVTWGSSVVWPSSTAPTITPTASKGDKYVFTADGTYWWGSVAGQNYL